MDTKDYFEISWATLRALVEPEVAKRASWTHEEHLKGGAKLVVGELKRVSTAAVELVDGTSLPYDYLVLAPGCAGGAGKPVHATHTARLAHFEAEAARLRGASSVLVVGGGPTGVELAGEIATDLPGKKVTLVSSTDVLCPMLVPSASKSLADELAGMGVRVLTGAKMARDAASGAFGAKTDKGDDVAADVVLDCTGSAPATAWARAPGGHPAIKLDEAGYIVVTPELRLADAPNVFALGDAAATADAKQGYLAVTNQAPTVAANLLASVAAPPKALKAAPTGPHGMMLVSLGRANGLLQAPGGWVMSGSWLRWLPVNIKCKGLFIDKVRAEHGLPK